MYLQEKLQSAKYRPSGFDYMRLVLSISVIVSHSFTVTEGAQIAHDLYRSPAGAVLKLIVPAFFVLSGFLVAGSMQRSNTLLTFLGLRILRIYPALIAEVLLSALILGPIVTEIPLSQYFSDPIFTRYLLNATGDVSYNLPGVFLSNPRSGIVNSQLWTVPWELACYSVLALFILGGSRRHRLVALAGFCLTELAFNRGYITGRHQLAIHYGHIPGLFLIQFFLCGLIAYLYKEYIIINRNLFAICLMLSMILTIYVPGGDIILPFPLTYCVVYLGSMNPMRARLLRHVDISYGIYLYGFVIQQFVVWAIPSARTWYLNTLLSVPLSILAGLLSWYGIERHALKLRPGLAMLEAGWLRMRGALLAMAPAPIQTLFLFVHGPAADKAIEESRPIPS
ncbi:acyltransferase [Novosphingobium sp.]|uniref:acyltransferase family protein n=1 Tax=Novosphingobium sp. TaxID=1874826 RepID=UPI00262F507D|nr:acyltransferase [Novosphingobium sp.]